MKFAEIADSDESDAANDTHDDISFATEFSSGIGERAKDRFREKKNIDYSSVPPLDSKNVTASNIKQSNDTLAWDEKRLQRTPQQEEKDDIASDSRSPHLRRSKLLKGRKEKAQSKMEKKRHKKSRTLDEYHIPEAPDTMSKSPRNGDRKTTSTPRCDVGGEDMKPSSLIEPTPDLPTPWSAAQMSSHTSAAKIEGMKRSTVGDSQSTQGTTPESQRQQHRLATDTGKRRRIDYDDVNTIEDDTDELVQESTSKVLPQELSRPRPSSGTTTSVGPTGDEEETSRVHVLKLTKGTQAMPKPSSSKKSSRDTKGKAEKPRVKRAGRRTIIDSDDSDSSTSKPILNTEMEAKPDIEGSDIPRKEMKLEETVKSEIPEMSVQEKSGVSLAQLPLPGSVHAANAKDISTVKIVVKEETTSTNSVSLKRTGDLVDDSGREQKQTAKVVNYAANSKPILGSTLFNSGPRRRVGLSKRTRVEPLHAHIVRK